MTIPIQHKRSSVPTKIPATTDLIDAEFAYNINDGKLYAKKTVSSVDSIIEIGAVHSVAGRIGDITLTQSDVSGTVASSTLAQPNGIATLDSSGKLLLAQLPPSIVGAVVYQGVWNASTNSPTLVSSTGTKGWYYKVSTAGSTSIDGNSQWNIGDVIIFNGNTWDKIDGVSSEVVSVFGRTGAVVLTSADVTTALGTVDGGTY